MRPRRPPRRPGYAAVPGSTAAFRAGQTGAGAPTYRPLTARQPKVQATFQPTKNTLRLTPVRPGRPFTGRNRDRYYNRMKATATGPNEMPYEYDPKADPMTLQGAVNRGDLPWSPALGKLGIQPPPRAPREIGIPGYNPDLRGAVESDWELGAARSDIAAQNAADAAAAAENINALAVGWGGDLSNMVRAGLISPQTAAAAKANQFSQMSELGRNLQMNTERGRAVAASRGILSSGATPGLEAEANRQYQQETGRGLLDLMSNIRGIRSQQAQGVAERMAGLGNVRANIAARLSGLEAYQPIPAMQARWDREVGAYVDDWGRRFDRRGNRLS